MINFENVTKETIKEHNPNWPQIPDHPFAGSGSRKTNALLNLINQQPDIVKILLYAKDPYEAKYQLLINKRESTGLNYLNDSKALLKKTMQMKKENY